MNCVFPLYETCISILWNVFFPFMKRVFPFYEMDVSLSWNVYFPFIKCTFLFHEMCISLLWNVHLHFMKPVFPLYGVNVCFDIMVSKCFSIIWKCFLTLIWGLVDNRLSDKGCLVDLPMKDITILIIRLFIQDYSYNKVPRGELVIDIENMSLDLIRPDDWTLNICTRAWTFAQELDPPWWLHEEGEVIAGQSAHATSCCRSCSSAGPGPLFVYFPWPWKHYFENIYSLVIICFLLTFMLFRAPTHVLPPLCSCAIVCILSLTLKSLEEL